MRTDVKQNPAGWGALVQLQNPQQSSTQWMFWMTANRLNQETLSVSESLKTGVNRCNFV
jgi:ribonuclease HI